MKHTVLIVDDHPIFRQGLSHLLDREEDLRVVGEADDGQAAIGLVRDRKPDIVIMDINMPGLNGIEATRRIVKEVPDTRVMALSVHSEKNFVRSMFEAGASGYILKESVPEEMVEGVRAVLSGNAYLSRSISNLLVSDYRTLLTGSGDGEAAEKSILMTKLYPLPMASHAIPRTRLIEILEKGADGAMTLIAAPAGYGKSVLASQWLDVSRLPAAWVSLDENDNDLICFLKYVLESIQRLFPGREWETLSLLKETVLPPAPEIGRCLLNDLERIESRFILVLDDYHHIRNAAIHDLMETLMTHPSPAMHLVLATRRDPPLSLVSLRSRGLLTEIALREISFNVSESRAFLERFLRIDIKEETVRVLQEKMDGWVTGLYLAALTMGDENDQTRLVTGLAGTSKVIREYLMNEVFSRMPAEIRENILKTALLDRFCAPMCDAIFSPDPKGGAAKKGMGGQQFVGWLIRNGMFVVPLDSGSRWVRYHPAFRQLLEEQAALNLAPERIASLHLRAGTWLSENGFVDEAINCLLADGQTDAAAEIIERNRRGAIDAEQPQTLRKWLNRLPREIQMSRPELLICRAWILLMERRIAEIPPIIERVAPLLADDSKHPDLVLELDFFMGLLSYFGGDGARSVALLEKIDKLPSDRLFAVLRAQARLWFCMALHLDGRKAEALRGLDCNIHNSDFYEIRFFSWWVWGLCAIYLLDGEFPLAFREGQRLLEISRANRFDDMETAAMHALGTASLQTFDLETARHYLGQVCERRNTAQDRFAVDAMAGLAMACCLLGDVQGAEEVLQLGKTKENLIRAPFYHEIISSCQARLDLLRGNIGPAHFWQRSVDHTSGNPVMLFFSENSDITQCRVLVAVGSEESLEKAVSKLETLRRKAEKWHNTRLLLEIMVLQALTIHRRGRLNDAMKALEDAITMAAPNEWLLPFVESAPMIIDTLHRLMKQNMASEFIERILSAHEKVETAFRHVETVSGNAIDQDSGSLTPAGLQPLVEPLTNREMDVLELLAQRFQNKEIADRLFISSDTVKGHLKNIFQKIGAVNRREAVEKARQLKIL